MHAASRHGSPTLTSLPKDGGMICSGRLLKFIKFWLTANFRTIIGCPKILNFPAFGCAKY